MGLLLTAFLTGLFSGGHCVAMCGGIVSALNIGGRHPVIRIQAGNTAGLQMSAMAMQLPLHLSYSGGRILSYAVAGGIAGSLGGFTALTQSVLPVQLLLGMFANLLLLALAFHLAGRGRLIAVIEKIGLPLWQRLSPVSKKFLPADTPGRAFAVGAVWGWLPCGLVYSMLGLALASGGTTQGALLMAAFGLGTLPTLVSAGFFIERLRRLMSKPPCRSIFAALIAAMALLGLARLPPIQEAIRRGLLCFA